MSAFEPVRYAALTDVGVKRSHNQDACAARPAVDAPGYEASGHVFVVADGMGGHAVGEKASAKAVQDIPHLYQKHAHEGVVPALRRAFAETNAGIHAIGQENPEFRGMGTTSTALILRPEGAWVGHVGDSRAYRIRDGIAEQLTFDHSWVWEIAKRQGVDPDELGDFKKNVIIRSLGPDPEVEIDIEGPHPVQPGDIFLLCSDGLTGLVNPTEIGAVVTAMPPDTAVRLLVHLANLRGGPDNITVMIIRVPGGAQGEANSKADKPRGLKRAVQTWNRAVPWPFTAIGARLCPRAGVLVNASVPATGRDVHVRCFRNCHTRGIARADSASQEGTGIVRARQSPRPPRTLNVYKRHECAITPELADKFAEVEKALADGMMGQDVPVDWEAHARILSARRHPRPRNRASTQPSGLAANRCCSWPKRFTSRGTNKNLFRPSWKDPDTPNDSASAVQ